MIIIKELNEVAICSDDGKEEFRVIGDIYRYNIHAIAFVFLDRSKIPEDYTFLKKESVKKLLKKNLKSLKVGQKYLPEKINKSLEMILRDLYNQKGKNQILII